MCSYTLTWGGWSDLLENTDNSLKECHFLFKLFLVN